MAARPTPFDLVFAGIADRRFPPIRSALERAGADPRDRDAWLLTPDAIELLRDLRPDEGLGEGMDQMVAFAHHGYLFWLSGCPVDRVTVNQLAALLDRPADASVPKISPVPDSSMATGEAAYAQLPERRVWAQVVPDEPHEPLDGCFTYATSAGELRVLGVFGVRPDRDGFSAVEVAGARPIGLAREDGAPLFSATLDGAESAGLRAIVGEEELLEFGWRARDAAGRAAWTA